MLSVREPRQGGELRTAAKVDQNHAEIMEALRKAGIAAKSTAAMGKGFPDIIAATRETTVLLEVKSGGEKPNTAQIEFMASWPGRVYVVRSGEEAVDVVIAAARPCACRKGVA